MNKLKAHVDEALFQSFERSDEGGIDLNSPLGNNALACRGRARRPARRLGRGDARDWAYHG